MTVIDLDQPLSDAELQELDEFFISDGMPDAAMDLSALFRRNKPF